MLLIYIHTSNLLIYLNTLFRRLNLRDTHFWLSYLFIFNNNKRFNILDIFFLRFNYSQQIDLRN